MTEAKKPQEPAYYVQQIGADIAESGVVAPLVHAAAAIGMLASTSTKPEETEKVFAGVIKAVQDAYAKAKGDEALQAAVRKLVDGEAALRKQAEGEDRMVAMHVSVPSGSQDEALRKTLAALKASGANLTGLMAFSDDGTLLHSEGTITDGMIPPGAKAPKDAQKH